VNLETGLIEREFTFTGWASRLALSPDASRLFVALSASVASFDLRAMVKDREIPIAPYPYDLLAPDGTHAAVGYDPISIRVYVTLTGSQTGSASAPGPYGSRLAQVPTIPVLYAASRYESPGEIDHLDLIPGGSISWRWSSYVRAYFGSLWASPLG